ncbi:MAG: binding-protein-dependent transport system inner rane component, partial [Paenibacillaceae bacterium]|nr:binding-protein-dependent transport system inner rane component [Paenibacillaceae bacterium]
SLFSNIEEMVRRQQLENLLKYALIVVATVPVMVIYPFVQKYFVKGIMIGSLKG